MQCRTCVATVALLRGPSPQELIRPCRCRAENAYVHRACLSQEPSTDHCSNCNMTYVRQDVSWVWWIRNVLCMATRCVLSPIIWRHMLYILVATVVFWSVALLLRCVLPVTLAPPPLPWLHAYYIPLGLYLMWPWERPPGSRTLQNLQIFLLLWIGHTTERASAIPHILLQCAIAGDDLMACFREQYPQVLHARQLDMVVDLSSVESPELMDTLLEHVPIRDLCVLVTHYMHGSSQPPCGQEESVAS
jgi:hypothetical protein